MDKERHMQDLIEEYHEQKLYYDNLKSKGDVVLRNMNEILEQMKEIEDDEIR